MDHRRNVDVVPQVSVPSTCIVAVLFVDRVHARGNLHVSLQKALIVVLRRAVRSACLSCSVVIATAKWFRSNTVNIMVHHSTLDIADTLYALVLTSTPIRLLILTQE